MKKAKKKSEIRKVYRLECVSEPSHKSLLSRNMEELENFIVAEKIILEKLTENERVAMHFKCGECGGEVKVAESMSLQEFIDLEKSNEEIVKEVEDGIE